MRGQTHSWKFINSFLFPKVVVYKCSMGFGEILFNNVQGVCLKGAQKDCLLFEIDNFNIRLLNMIFFDSCCCISTLRKGLDLHRYISRKLAFTALLRKILPALCLSDYLTATCVRSGYGICLSNFVKTFPEPHSTNSSTPWERMNCIVSVHRTEEWICLARRSGMSFAPE